MYFVKVTVLTPAILFAKKNNITFNIFEYTHDSNVQSYGLEAAEKLKLNPSQVFKTLVVETDCHELIVAIQPVNKQLNLKVLAKSIGAKKVIMAAQQRVERTTGYVLGGVSPLGQKKQLKTVIDNSALKFETIFVSAGRRGLELELSAKTLSSLVQGLFVEISC